MCAMGAGLIRTAAPRVRGCHAGQRVSSIPRGDEEDCAADTRSNSSRASSHPEGMTIV